MRLFCCYTPAHEILFAEHFRPSIPEGFELMVHRIDLKGPGDYLSEEFLECIRRKSRLIRESIERHRGEVIVWSDVDIRFYRPVMDELRALLETSAQPILFQKEDRASRDVNTGFFVCHCCEEVDALFERVETDLQANPGWNEQRAVNERIAAGGLVEFGYLPMTYYARTHGWPPPRDLRIHHANYTVTPGAVQQKIEQFAEVEQAVGSRLGMVMTSLRAAKALGPSALARAVRRRLVGQPRRP